MFEKAAEKALLKTLERMEAGSIEVTLPSGERHAFKGSMDGPKADIAIHDMRVIPNLAARGSIGFADDYRQGKWDTTDLAALVEFYYRNSERLTAYSDGSRLRQMLTSLSYWLNRNSKKGSRRNIHAHYDLGNDFYRLWLDPSMTYSSAMFKKPNDSLAKAQSNKYDRIIGKLGKAPLKILEIGCGWGGFAERCCKSRDHHVTGITISREQYEYATDRLQRQKLPSEIKMVDYREVREKFDAVVSIEMFEAVGESYWKTYFERVKAALKSNGRAIIQTITVDDSQFESYRKTGDAIRTFIFPGGMLPSLQRFHEEAERAGLKVTEVFSFGQDYARTLQTWLRNFNAVEGEIKSLNFDEPFMRIWRFYLASCQAAFQTGRTNVSQIELRHA